MLKIALCDDDAVFLKELTGKIQELLRFEEKNAAIASFVNPTALTASVASGDRFDIFILDVEMPQIDGFKVTADLRKYQPNVALIFLTSHLQYAPEGYKVDALRFISKLNVDETLPEALQKALHTLEQQDQHSLLVQHYKITDIALYMAARKYLSKLSELKSRWLITLLFSGSLVYLITQILFRAILSEDYIQLYRASILSFLILILFFATLFLLLLNASAREHENVQKQLLLRTNQLMEQNYQMLHEDLKENAKRLHDFHHHLKAILGLAETAQNSEIQKYVGDLLSISYKEVHLCRCGNDVIDAILNCSAAEAKKQQTYFQYEVNFTAHIPVAPVDLCAILGNQIENALEANRQIADISARYVKIMLTQKKGFLIFRVENASAENPFSESGALKTRKEDGNLHGLGIKNIQDTANKYNGWLKNSYDDHTFISEVLLCVSTV